MLGDHFLVGQRPDLLRDFALRAPLKAHSLPPPAHDAGVQIVGVVHVPSEDDRQIRCTKAFQESFHRAQDGQTTAGECGRLRVEKEVLHVHYHQGHSTRPHCHLVEIKWGDLCQPIGGLLRKRLGGYVILHRAISFLAADEGPPSRPPSGRRNSIPMDPVSKFSSMTEPSRLALEGPAAAPDKRRGRDANRGQHTQATETNQRITSILSGGE